MFSNCKWICYFEVTFDEINSHDRQKDGVSFSEYTYQILGKNIELF